MGIFNRSKLKADDRAPKKESKPRAPKKTEEAKPEKVKKDMVPMVAGVDRVLVRPYVSEKAVTQEARGTYTFVVHADATKLSVKEAVKKMYGVMPEAVRMVNVEGKDARFGRYTGKRHDWKKAIITLPKGKTISIHTGV
ncbi:MAG TPA: 50S ribosomal protein L23 [Candidatus Kapabacteria bacterium]|nr:50S ribosomal protein L23 [Candidatus Kapabacteria bacterium]